MAISKRTDADYEIEGFTKVWKVFEALEGTNCEPVDAARVLQRCGDGFNRDLIMRSLRTLRHNGLVFQTDRGLWTYTGRALRLAAAITRNSGV